MNPKTKRLHFRELLEAVIDYTSCSACGACVGTCPRDVIGLQERPYAAQMERCTSCEICHNLCHRFSLERKTDLVLKKNYELHPKEKGIRPLGRNWDDDIGGYLQLLKTRSLEDVDGQDSGTTTSLLCHALETGVIDGALVTVRDEVWKTSTIVATTVEEIKSAAGSKFSVSNVLNGVREATKEKKLKKLGIVALPCQAEGSRILSKARYKKFGIVQLIIGLFCLDFFSYKAFSEKFSQDFGIDLRNVSRMEIDKEWILDTSDGRKVFPLSSTNKYIMPGCFHCPDFSAEFADVSVGNIGTGSGFTTTIVRSKLGESLLKNAISNDVLEAHPLNLEDLEGVRRMSRYKKRRLAQHMKKKH